MKVSKTFYQDMEDLPASHPLYGSEQSKSGFGICYQFAIKCPVSVSKTQCFQGFAGFVSYSHSVFMAVSPMFFGVFSSHKPHILERLFCVSLFCVLFMYLEIRYLTIIFILTKGGFDQIIKSISQSGNELKI